MDYVECFFDVVNEEAPHEWRDLSTYHPAEVAALEQVQRLLVDACAATNPLDTDDAFIASGWPERIKPVAASALALI